MSAFPDTRIAKRLWILLKVSRPIHVAFICAFSFPPLLPSEMVKRVCNATRRPVSIVSIILPPRAFYPPKSS